MLHAKKEGFVLDTNFIIENLSLKKVVANLSEEFTVYREDRNS